MLIKMAFDNQRQLGIFIKENNDGRNLQYNSNATKPGGW